MSDGSAPAASGPPSVAVRNVVVGVLVLCVAAAYTGQALVGSLAEHHPLVLIALNARSSFLILASPRLSPTSYYAVGIARISLSFPLFFLLGRWYGDAAVRWMERKVPSYGRMMRTAERWFAKAAYPLVAVVPNDYFCLFAGASGMSTAGFLVSLTAGNVVRLYLLRALGERLTRPLDSFTHWMGQHWLVVTVVMVLVIALSIWSERRRGGEDELSILVHLGEDLGQAPRPAVAADGGSDAGAVPPEPTTDV